MKLIYLPLHSFIFSGPRCEDQTANNNSKMRLLTMHRNITELWYSCSSAGTTVLLGKHFPLCSMRVQIYGRSLINTAVPWHGKHYFLQPNRYLNIWLYTQLYISYPLKIQHDQIYSTAYKTSYLMKHYKHRIFSHHIHARHKTIHLWCNTKENHLQ